MTDISALSDLDGLRELDLSFNSVNSAAQLADLTALVDLNLSNTSVSNLGPLRDNEGFGTSGSLRLVGTTIDCETQGDHINELRVRGMEVIGACE